MVGGPWCRGWWHAEWWRGEWCRRTGGSSRLARYGVSKGQYLALYAVTTFVRTADIIDRRRFSEVLVGHHGPIKHYIKEIDNLSGGTLRH